ncbi:MAG: hypothetical protein L3J34_05065 [Flavobacteriaceae bacterium]|nr:hypothetical protein [Flavobacteriaceae bacterium]
MKLFKYISIFIILASCTNMDDINNNSLSTYTLNKTIETGAVIACAASDEVTNDVLVFYYPKAGA